MQSDQITKTEELKETTQLQAEAHTRLDQITQADIVEPTFSNTLLSDFIPLYFGWLVQVLHFYMSAYFQSINFSNYMINAVKIEAISTLTAEVIPLSFSTMIGLIHRQAYQRRNQETLKKLQLLRFKSYIWLFSFSYVFVFVLTVFVKVDPQFNSYYKLKIGMGPIFGIFIEDFQQQYFCHQRSLLAASKRTTAQLMGFSLEALIYIFTAPGLKTNVPTIIGYLIPNIISVVWTLLLYFKVTLMKVKLDDVVTFNQIEYKSFPKEKSFKREFWKLLGESYLNIFLESLFYVFIAVEIARADLQQQRNLFVLFNFGYIGRISGRVFYDICASLSGYFVQNENFTKMYTLYLQFFVFVAFLSLVFLTICYFLLKIKTIFGFDHNNMLVILATIGLYVIRPMQYVYILISIIFKQTYATTLIIVAKIVVFCITANQKSFTRIIFQEYVGYAVSIMLCLSVVSKVLESRGKQKVAKKYKVSWEEDVLIED